jgi:hypothetical protein
VEEDHGIQAGPGDLLFLKGQSFPGLYGEHHAFEYATPSLYCRPTVPHLALESAIRIHPC